MYHLLCSKEVHLPRKIRLFSLVKNKLKHTAVSRVLLSTTVGNIITPNP